MLTRCTTCNNWLSFSNRRGAKLLNCRCNCGGSFEKLTMTQVEGEHPIDPNKGYIHVHGELMGQKYFYAYKNSKGELFEYVRENPKVIPLTTAPQGQ